VPSIAWDGRVEHVVSGQVMHFHAEDARRQRQNYVDNYLGDYHHHYLGGYPVGAGLAGGYLYGKHEESKQAAYQQGVADGTSQSQQSSGSR
jgi:hypothetical protein